METINRILLVIALVVALACMLFISIIMSITVLERRREFAVLKAVGWRGGHIVGLVLIESLILSLAGTLWGLGIGYAASLAAERFLGLSISVVSGEFLMLVAAMGILVGSLGGLYPALRANKTSPVEIFRQG
jgi:putative ABC transport system permease protein